LNKTDQPPAPLLDTCTRYVSETLARAVNRRTFLWRAGGGVFLALITWTAGLGFGPRRAAAQTGAGGLPCCTPPGPYCNLDGNGHQPNGCQGANCFEHLDAGVVLTCAISAQYFAAGCWTTHCNGGYWTCCDCACSDGHGRPIVHCGCAQFSTDSWQATD